MTISVWEGALPAQGLVGALWSQKGWRPAAPLQEACKEIGRGVQMEKDTISNQLGWGVEGAALDRVFDGRLESAAF